MKQDNRDFKNAMVVTKMIEIDGSIGEGGGQILRTAISLSAILDIPVKIFNIRKRRPRPGLKPQHLHAIKAIVDITDAKVDGLHINSQTIYFEPSTIKGGTFKIDVGTAGSISLILQALLPVIVFGKQSTKVEIFGGTDTKWAPPIDYIKYILQPYLDSMGTKVKLNVLRRGHYPRGGGHVQIITNPIQFLSPLSILRQGNIKMIKGVSHAVKLPRHVAERQATAAKEQLYKNGFKNVEITLDHSDDGKHLGPGSGIVLWSISDTNSIIGGDALGERGKRAEVVGKEAAEKLIMNIKKGAAIDEHLSDMLLIWLVLAKGKSEILAPTLTMHTKTNIEIINAFLQNKISYKKTDTEKYLITVHGIGKEGYAK